MKAEEENISSGTQVSPGSGLCSQVPQPTCFTARAVGKLTRSMAQGMGPGLYDTSAVNLSKQASRLGPVLNFYFCILVFSWVIVRRLPAYRSSFAIGSQPFMIRTPAFCIFVCVSLSFHLSVFSYFRLFVILSFCLFVFLPFCLSVILGHLGSS